QAKVQLRIKPEVFETGGGGQAALRAVDRAVMLSCDEEVGAHVGEDTGQPVSIAECGRQRLGGADVLDHPIVLAERHVSVAEVQPQVDRLFERLAALREMLQDDQRVVTISY